MNSKAINQNIVIGVLALQGAFCEHILLLQKAAQSVKSVHNWTFKEVRNEAELNSCNALIIPGGESTTISLVAQRSGLLDSLRHFVKTAMKPTWGTCAGLILLADRVNNIKEGGQELIGGLAVQVNRNYFGRQAQSFEADLILPFLAHCVNNDCDFQGDPSEEPKSTPFRAIFIRAPVVERVLTSTSSNKQLSENPVEILGRLRVGAAIGEFDENKVSKIKCNSSGFEEKIVAVRQGNIFGTSFHPELTGDDRIHRWWLEQVLMAIDH